VAVTATVQIPRGLFSAVPKKNVAIMSMCIVLMN
jgi:hypothetical protein